MRVASGSLGQSLSWCKSPRLTPQCLEVLFLGAALATEGELYSYAASLSEAAQCCNTQSAGSAAQLMLNTATQHNVGTELPTLVGAASDNFNINSMELIQNSVLSLVHFCL